MDITPQLLHEIEFREAKRGGYDTRDVDDFLEKLAVGVEQLVAQLREARQRAESADSRVADAERRASTTSEHDETLKRTLVLAQRTADAAIKEAEEEASRTLSSAQEEANRLLTEAREASANARAEAENEAHRAHEEAQAKVLAELQQLEGTRDAVRGDVDALEQHLEAQREHVRSSVHELQRLLDDPDALRSSDQPDLSGATLLPTSLAADAFDEGSPDEIVDLDGPSAAANDEGAFTQPVEAVGAHRAVADSDDDYLAELRRAMTDERPLTADEPAGHSLFESAAERSERPRFGRRR